MAIFLNNQGVRTPPERGLGRSVHTFRRELFVKFRKSRHRTEKALRHAQKPANPRSTNPIGSKSTYVEPEKCPPYGNPPPQGPKNDVGETLPGHSRPLLRLAKVTQKRGFSQRFPGGFPAVLPVVSRRLSSGFPTVFQRFSSSFTGGFPTVFRRFSGGSTTVFQRFSGGFPAVRQRFSSGFPAVRQRFAGNTLPLDQPPAGSGLLLHPKETVGNSVHSFRRTNPA